MATVPQTLYGAHLQPLREFATPEALENATLQALYRALDIGDLVAFAGAGMSVDYGYPVWSKLGTEVVSAVKKAAEQLKPPLGGVEQQFLDQIDEERLKQVSGTELTSILDYCQRLFFRRDQESKFREIALGAIFSGPFPSMEPPMSPIKAVIQYLKIRRFVTTNYDSVIPKVLLPELIREDLALLQKGEPMCPTINRLNAAPADLILFAMGVGTYRSGVVNLHGSAKDREDKDADIVLTETQYQRPYASNDALMRDLREAYGLIFAANSVLFVGTSLEEDDILRPLRQFVSDNDIASRHRPWFALIDSPPDVKKHRAEIFNRYYYRYGIRVIFVNRNDNEKRGQALVHKIREIQKGWEEYRRERTDVPHARIPRFHQVPKEEGHSVIAHHAAVHNLPPVQLKLSTLLASREPLKRDLRKSFFILGQQGRGKGWAGYEIAQYRHRDNIPTLGFFGTTHFANEFFSLVDGARRHLVAAMENDRSLSDRTGVEGFFDALRKVQADCFFVFGGVGRLLRNLPYDMQEQPRDSAANALPGNTPEETSDIDPDSFRMLMQFRWGRSASLEISQFLNGVLKFGCETFTTEQQSGRAPEVGFYKCVFLTSSVLPHALQQEIKHSKRRGCRPVFIGSIAPNPAQCSMDDTLSDAGGNDHDALQVPLVEICRLVPQNLYATDVVHHIVRFALAAESHGTSPCLAWLRDLALNLGRTEPQARPEEVMRSAVSFLSSGNIFGDPPMFRTDFSVTGSAHNRRWTRLAMVLETLSLFTTPVEAYVLAAALDTSPMDPYVNAALRERKEPKECQWTPEDWRDELPNFLEEVYHNTRLVLRIRAVPESGVIFRYTAHSLVRSAMLRRLGGRPNRPAEIQQFDLNDFASEPADVQPLRVEGAERTLRAFDALVVKADEAFGCMENPDVQMIAKKAKLRAFVRGAYGVLRAGWSATGLGRLLTESPSVGSPAPVYQQYHRRLTRLLNLVHAYDRLSASPPSSGDQAAIQPTKSSEHDGALYHDELAWLFNELGLVCYCQGALPDSSAFFRLGERINRRIESGEPVHAAGVDRPRHPDQPGYRQIESKINLASVLIDRARLSRARDALIQAATFTRECRGDADRIRDEIMARIHGFLGLVAHLSGDSRTALALYGSAIDVLSRCESWRGVSVFSRHRSDLHRAENRLKEAREDLATAVAAAEEGFHPDLVHFCRVSEANLVRTEVANQVPDRISVAASLEPTLRFARNIGSAKLESDVYRVMGLIELDQRDFEAATRSALNCLWLASAYHLRLRLMSSLELLGRLMRKRGDLHGARNVFESVVKLGQSFEFRRPAEFADKALAELTLRQR